MPEWLDRLLRKRQKTTDQQQEHLVTESQFQSLRLALNAKDDEIAHLKDRLERLQKSQTADFSARQKSLLEKLFSAIAQPLMQNLAQCQLAEAGKPIKPQNLLRLNDQILNHLSNFGFAAEGQWGRVVAYDPKRHALMNAETSVQPGTPVKIQIQGASFDGHNILKAFVTPSAMPKEDSFLRKD